MRGKKVKCLKVKYWLYEIQVSFKKFKSLISKGYSIDQINEEWKCQK